ncbi:hypothetical protein TrST_g6560 [Triparma strigata]|uniref:BspA family leucine-rich repeat surface protein n=1 Tax=Triparma strigata TaxID=1606541 RepID=A0A9W7ECK5_9STRA|nr:hypothetical protein TrST_g6560 [Triparma strigata]
MQSSDEVVVSNQLTHNFYNNTNASDRDLWFLQGSVDNSTSQETFTPAYSSALKASLDDNFISYSDDADEAALVSLLSETLGIRSRIPSLNSDVQGYIVSFLSGYDSLHVATQLARSFRLRAKPRLEAMLKRSDADIKVAAKAWCEDVEAAREIYGPISIWNTSEVTDMRQLFCADDEYAGYEEAEHFDEDITRWDVSNVEDMGDMFHGAELFNCNLSSWNVEKVTNMVGMFAGAKKFDKSTIKSWELNGKDTLDMLGNWEEDMGYGEGTRKL